MTLDVKPSHREDEDQQLKTIKKDFMKSQTFDAPVHNFVGATETQRLMTLETEQKQLSERMAQIQREATQLYDTLRSRIAPEFMADAGLLFGSYKRPATHPRPIHDKLTISAGRAIVAGLKKGYTPAVARENAIQAANRVAKRYGVTELPPDVMLTIDNKIRLRYNLN